GARGLATPAPPAPRAATRALARLRRVGAVLRDGDLALLGFVLGGGLGLRLLVVHVLQVGRREVDDGPADRLGRRGAVRLGRTRGLPPPPPPAARAASRALPRRSRLLALLGVRLRLGLLGHGLHRLLGLGDGLGRPRRGLRRARRARRLLGHRL